MSSNGANGHIAPDYLVSMVGHFSQPPKDTTFRDVLEAIAAGEWARPIAAIRKAHAASGKPGSDPLKKNLPGVMFSGKFSYRDAKHLVSHSGLICADLDHLDERLEAVREHIVADPHVLACFVSPTGTGLKLIFRVDPAQPHFESYRAAEQFVREAFGLEIDTACSDVSRLCFVSHDPDAFIAKDALVLPYPPPVEEIEEPPVHHDTASVEFPAGSIKPGDDYDSRGDWQALLTGNGWTKDGDHFWVRPGKTANQGAGATWDRVPDHPKRFYCFTSNAQPLQNRKLYKPWHLYAEFNCGGDLHQAAKELYAKGYGTRLTPATPRSEPLPSPAAVAHLKLEDDTPPRFPGDALLPPPASPASDWPDPVSAADLCLNPPPTPEELIEGLLYAPGTLLLSGPSKSRKTFTTLDLAIAIASGGKWLGRQCAASPVLYLNLELQDFAITERIAKICGARGHPAPANLHIWNLRGKKVSLLELKKRLPAKIAAMGAKAVAVDPHYKISSVSGMEESSNDDMGLLLGEMESLCHDARSALILTHHFAKGDASAKNAADRASGAGTFTRWPDVFVTFTPHAEEDNMTIDFFLRNFAPVPSFVVRWLHPRWQLEPSLDPLDLKRAPNAGSFKEKYSADDLLACLGTNLWSNKEWESASKLKHGTFLRKRDELIQQEKVVCYSGCYRRK